MLLGINVQMDGKMLDWNFEFQIIWEIFSDSPSGNIWPYLSWSSQLATSRQPVVSARSKKEKYHAICTYVWYVLNVQDLAELIPETIQPFISVQHVEVALQYFWCHKGIQLSINFRAHLACPTLPFSFLPFSCWARICIGANKPQSTQDVL